MAGKTRQLKHKRQIQRKPPAHEHAAAREAQPETSAAEPDIMSNVLALEVLRQTGTTRNGPLQRQAVNRLAPLLGNKSLQRIIEGEETAEGTTVADDAMPADMANFLSQAFMPGPNGVDITPTGIGGFNAKFDSAARQLVITLNIGFNFPNGLNVDATTGAVTANSTGLDLTDPDEVGTFGELQAAANQIMTDIPTPADRVNEVQSKWQWAGEEDTWMTQYQGTVQSAWGGRHFFVSEDWPQLMAGVRVNVNVHRNAQAADHCLGKIIKTPPGGIGAYVQSGSATNANDQELIMSSSAIAPRPDNLLRHQIYFPNNSADINAATTQPDGAGTAAPTFLQQYIATFNAAPGNAGQPVHLVGHASAVGATDYNQTLSEQRSAAVENFLISNGLTGSVDRTVATGEGETGDDTNAAESRRVDLSVGSGEAQVVAAHETGHLLGLDDEYATGAGSLISGSGNPIGSSVAHSDIDANALADAPIDGAVSENNDNIMSLGNTVRPQHYSTFFTALEQVTARNWRYGGEGDPPTVIPGTPVPGGVVV